MGRLRIPLGATVASPSGTNYLAFVEGRLLAGGEVQARLAFMLPDETGVVLTKPIGEIHPNEESVRAWANTLSTGELERVLREALEDSGDPFDSPPVPRTRC